jgi:hypothetical protein
MIKVFGYALICIIALPNIPKGNERNLVNRIVIHYIFSGTETSYNISCKAIDSYAGTKELMTEEIRNSQKIGEFMNSLRNYNKAPAMRGIDVRAKAYIHHSSGRTSVMCVDRFGDFMLGGKIVGTSPLLLSFIEKNCKGFK